MLPADSSSTPSGAPLGRALWIASLATLAVTTLAVGAASQFAFTLEEFVLPKSAALAVGGLVCALLVARAVVRSAVRVDLLDAIVAAYFVCGIVSWWLNGSLRVDLADWLGRDAGTAIVFLSVPLAVAGRGPRKHERLILILALVLAAVAFAEARGAVFPFSPARRPGSLLGNRNFVGAYVAIALPFACAFALDNLRWWKCAPVAVLTAAVLITRCRSAWLGLLLAAGLCAVLTTLRPARWTLAARRGALALAFGVAIGAAGASLPWPGLHWRESNPIGATAARLLQHDEGSGRIRVAQLRTAVVIARSAPLGAGPGSWDDAENAVNPVRDWRLNPTPSSELARLLGELGFVGAAVAAAATALLFAWGVRAVRASSSLSGLAPLAALVVCTVHALLDAPLFRAPLAVLLATVAGLVHALPLGEKNAAAPRTGLWGVRLLAGAGARWGTSVAIVGLGAIGLVSPLLGLIAGVRSGAHRDMESIAATQRIYPREYIAEHVARTFVAEKKCDHAAPEIERLRRWSPHLMGPLRLRAECARQRGDEAAARSLDDEVAKMAAHHAQPAQSHP